MTTAVDVSLVVSLYRSARHLRRFVNEVAACARVVATAGSTLQLVIVANDATIIERYWIGRLRRLASLQNGLVVDVIMVGRETLYSSWNRGVALAGGDCIGFWNCDDVRNPLALLEGLEAVRNGADVVYFKSVEFYPGRGLLRRSPTCFRFPAVPEFDRSELRRSMYIGGAFFLMSPRAWEKVGQFDPQFQIAGDFEWCARAAETVDFVLAREIGGVYTRYPRTLSGTGNPRQAAENNIVYLRSGAFDKLEAVDAMVMSRYKVDLPWRKYSVPDAVLEKLAGPPSH